MIDELDSYYQRIINNKQHHHLKRNAAKRYPALFCVIENIHKVFIKFGTTDYIIIAIRSRKFSPSFCIYIQTNLNLFLLTVTYSCWRKE